MQIILLSLHSEQSSLKMLIYLENAFQSLNNLPPTLIILDVRYNFIKNIN